VRAFLFPGQGARNVVPAWEWLRGRGAPTPLLDIALEVSGLDEAALLRDEGRALERTEVLQPVLIALSLTVHALLRDVVACDVVAGHSLGELAAVSAAGAFDAETAVRLAATRGQTMAAENAKRPGGLVVVASREEAAKFPALELAAVNARDEFVLGGALEVLPPLRRVPVSGAWHTSAMAGAVGPFREALTSKQPRPLTTPLVRNLDGAEVRDCTSLPAQLERTVEFVRVLDALVSRGVDEVVVLGPGLVLRGLLRRHGGALRVHTTEDEVDLRRWLKDALPR